jgi:Ca2+-binding RTX toxin-like protein
MDTIVGGDGNDTLYGKEWADELYGGTGDDSLNGGTWIDAVLDGGDGNDIVWWDPTENTTNCEELHSTHHDQVPD